MSRVRGRDTKPERVVRRLLTSLGYRYRLQYTKLPGKPDIVFPGRQKVILVHGCFWHRHSEHCPLTRLPKSRLDFWRPKLIRNHERDQENEKRLRELGWDVMVVWECELTDLDTLRTRLTEYLG